MTSDKQKPTEKQIEAERERAMETEDDSKFPAMTYEQGVMAALEWVLRGGTPPMDD